MNEQEKRSFVQFLREEVDKIIRGKNLFLTFPATVVSVETDSVGNNFATVTLAGSTTSIVRIPNPHNFSLTTGDNVYLYSPTGKLNNAYIGVKFIQYT